jgi:hypothetical protein
MVNALAIARNLRADDAIGVGVIFGTPNPAYPAVSAQLDIQRTRRGAVVRAS